jgi:hypothetical protein
MTNANLRSKRAVVDALKLEIAMIRDGRYNPPAGHPQAVPRPLRDSVTCPNATLPDDRKEVPCEECILHRFLPDGHPQRELACYDIPLNQHGETLAQLKQQGDPEKMQSALLSWLYKTVAKLEAEISVNSVPSSALGQTSSSCNAIHHG